MILNEATWDNFFIVKACWYHMYNVARVILALTKKKKKLQVPTLPGYTSVRIFQCKHFVLCSFDLYSMVLCSLFVFECFVPGIKLLLKTCIRAMLLILLCCCVDMFYIKFTFCETFTVINSVTRILLIETLHKFRTIKC